MPRKTDADEILEHLRALPATASLDSSRRWWPKYLYHSAHVENAARILNDGRVLSRRRVVAEGRLALDCASPRILQDLPSGYKRWVRLYFRPRAPTQYANEGVRPRSQYEYGAHMPVPIYLLFSAADVLAQSQSRFTRGRLEQGAPMGSTADFFRLIPFADVYHDAGVGPLGSPRRADILNARHAEVLIPDELPLRHLKLVLCRSQPERATLLELMTQSARTRWKDKIAIQTHQNVFHKRGTYVASASLASDASQFRFYTSIPESFRGPFDLTIDWSGSDGWSRRWCCAGYKVPTEPLRFRFHPPASDYQVTMRMDGNLVYKDRYTGDIDESEIL